MRLPTDHAVQVSAQGAAHPHAHLQFCKLIERISSLRADFFSALASGLATHHTCTSVGRCGHAHTWGSPAAFTAASASENARLRRQLHEQVTLVGQAKQRKERALDTGNERLRAVVRTRLPRGRDGFPPQGLFFTFFRGPFVKTPRPRCSTALQRCWRVRHWHQVPSDGRDDGGSGQTAHPPRPSRAAVHKTVHAVEQKPKSAQLANMAPPRRGRGDVCFAQSAMVRSILPHHEY